MNGHDNTKRLLYRQTIAWADISLLFNVRIHLRFRLGFFPLVPVLIFLHLYVQPAAYVRVTFLIHSSPKIHYQAVFREHCDGIFLSLFVAFVGAPCSIKYEIIAASPSSYAK